MNSESILLLNAIAYTLTLVFFYRKGKISLGFILWSLYTISSWASYLFVRQPLYKESIHYSDMALFPCVYLFVLLFLCIKPFVQVNKIDAVDITNDKGLKYLLYICIIVQLLLIIPDINSVIHISTSSMELVDVRMAAYGRDADSLSNIGSNSMLNRLSLLYSGMKPLAIGLSIFLLFVYKKQRNLVKIFAITTLLYSLKVIIITAGRGELVITLTIYGCSLFLIRNELSQRIKKILIVCIIPIFIISIYFFYSVTISRFGDSAGFFMYKYMGEPMNNFCGILFNNIDGYTNGRAQFSYIYRYLFGELDFVNTEGRYELMENVNGITPFIFYTFIGSLIMEFGKVIPIFIAFLLNRFGNWLVRKQCNHIGIITIYTAIIYFYIYGLFTFPVGNFTGITMIAYLFIINQMFKYKAHMTSNI